MFEVDSWDVGTENEEKLVRGLFGEVRRKRKHEEKLQTATWTDNKKRDITIEIDTTKENNEIKIHDRNPKKRKSLIVEKEVQITQNSAVSRPKQRKKKPKNKQVKNVNENVTQEVNKRVMGTEEKNKHNKEKNAEYQRAEELDGSGTKMKKKKRKQKKKSSDDFNSIENNDEPVELPISDSPKHALELVKPKEHVLSKGFHSKKAELQERLKKKLESSRFRWINEQLYTIPGDEAFSMFKGDTSLFDVYHQGFRRQVEQWPINPVDVIIDWVKERSPSQVLADFGCGEAVIAQSVANKVHSFDLVAANERVTACNMAKVPLESASVDVAIFCLSLMGTDLESFLKEAHRVLKPGGVLKIAEVVSRMETNTFVPALCQFGFKLDNIDDSNKMFILLDFIKDPNNKKAKGKQNVTGLKLKPCIYKRR